MKFWMILVLCVVLTPWFWQVQRPSKTMAINLAKDISEAKLVVEWKRGKALSSPFSRLFINWPLELVNQRMGVVMENLDIGNYVFVGHPRERVGIVEVQKLFMFQAVLFVLGFGSSKLKKPGKYLLLYSVVALLLVFIFKLRTAVETLILAPPLVFMTTLGLEKLLVNKTKWKYLFIMFGILEIILFLILS